MVLFQEQILRIAMELGGFTAAEADELRLVMFNPDNIIQGPDDAKLDWCLNVLNSPEE